MSLPEPPSVPARQLWPYVFVLAAVLVGVQLPRFLNFAGRAAAPVYARDRGFLDFDFGYYPAGLAVRSDPSLLYMGAKYDAAAGSVKINAPANFVNIPLIAWLFVPFTLLPLPQAGRVLLLCNIAISLFSLWLLLRQINATWMRWAVTLAFASSGPLINALNLGQTTPLVLLLLILMQGSYLRNQHGRAGALLGIVSLIKIPPALLLFYFVLRKEWKVVAWAVAVVASAFAASLLLYGWELHREYTNLVFRSNLGKAIAAHNCQSISSFLARTFTGASLLSWQPVELPLMARVVQVAMQLAILAGLVVSTLQSRVSLPPLHAFLTAGLLLLPISWSHYGAWMLPVFAAQIAANRSWIVPAVALVLINLPVLPVPIVRHFDQAVWFRVAVSHMFFGLLILQVLLYMDRREKL